MAGRVPTAEEEFVLSGLKPYEASPLNTQELPPESQDPRALERELAIQRAQAMDIPLALLGRPGFPLSYFGGRGEAAVRRNMAQLSSKMRSINNSMRGALDEARARAVTAGRADYAAVEAISTLMDQTQGVFAPGTAYREALVGASGGAKAPAEARQDEYAGLARSLGQGLRETLGGGRGESPRRPEQPPRESARTPAPRDSPGRRRRLDPIPGREAAAEGPGSRPGSAPRERRAGATRGAAPLKARPAPDMSHVDDLYWVKKLVSTAEGSLTIPDEIRAGAPGLGKKGTLPPVGSLGPLGTALGAAHGQPGPGLDGERATMGLSAARGTRREDVELLQGWVWGMIDKMALRIRRKVFEHEGGAQSAEKLLDGDGELSVEGVSDAVLFVYSVAAEELQRQVGIECRERGELFGLLWGQFFTLVELRAALKYQRDVAAANEALVSEQRRTAEAEALIAAMQEQGQEAGSEHNHEVNRMRMENRTLAEKFVKTRNELAELQKVYESTEDSLKAEIREKLKVKEQADRLDRILTDLADKLQAEQRDKAQKEQALEKRGNQIQDMAAQVRSLLEGVQELDEAKKSLARQLAAEQDRSASLETELEATRVNLEDKKRQLEAQTLELERTKALHADMDKDRAKLEAEAEAQRARINELTRSLADSAQANNSLELMIEQLRTEIASKESDWDDARAELQEEVLSLKVRLEKQEGELQRLLKVRDELESKCDLLSAENGKSGARIEALSVDRHETVARCKHLLDALKAKAGARESVRSVLTMLDKHWHVLGQEGRVAMTLDACRDVIDYLGKDSDSLRAEVAEWREKCGIVTKDRDEMLSKVMDAKTVMERATADARGAERMKRQAEADRDVARRQADAYRAERDAQEDQIRDLKLAIQQQLDRDAEKMERLRQYEEAERSMKEALGLSTDQNVSIAETVKSLDTALADLEAKTAENLGNIKRCRELQEANAGIQDKLRSAEAETAEAARERDALREELDPLKETMAKERAAAAGLLVRNAFLEEQLRKGQRALITSQFLVTQLGAPAEMDAVIPAAAAGVPAARPRVEVPEVSPSARTPMPAAAPRPPSAGSGRRPSTPGGKMVFQGLEKVDEIIASTEAAVQRDRDGQMELFSDYIADAGKREQHPARGDSAALRGHDAMRISGLEGSTPGRPSTARSRGSRPASSRSHLGRVAEGGDAAAGGPGEVYAPDGTAVAVGARWEPPAWDGASDGSSPTRGAGTRSPDGRPRTAGSRPGSARQHWGQHVRGEMTEERRVLEIKRHLQELGSVPPEVAALVKPPPRTIRNVQDLVDVEVDAAMLQTEAEARALAAERIRAVMSGQVQCHLDEGQMKWLLTEAGQDPREMDPVQDDGDVLLDEQGNELVRKDQADLVTRELRARIFWLRAAMGIVADFSKALRRRIRGLEKDNLELVLLLDTTKVEMMELLVAQQNRWFRRSAMFAADRKAEITAVQSEVKRLRIEAADIRGAVQRVDANMTIRDRFLEGEARRGETNREAGAQAGPTDNAEARAFLKSLGSKAGNVKVMGPGELLQHVIGVFSHRSDVVNACAGLSEEDARHPTEPMEQPIFDTLVEYIMARGLEGGVVMQGPGGYLAQVLVSVGRHHGEHPALGLFARLSGTHPSWEENLPVAAWTVVAQLLVMLRRLLGIKWRLLQKEWLKGKALISDSLVRDLCGNMYNTNMIDALKPYSKCFAPRLLPAQEAGGVPTMTIEGLFEAAIEAWQGGDGPRAATFFPRRVDAVAGSGLQAPPKRIPSNRAGAGAARRGAAGVSTTEVKLERPDDIIVPKGQKREVAGVRGEQDYSRSVAARSPSGTPPRGTTPQAGGDDGAPKTRGRKARQAQLEKEREEREAQERIERQREEEEKEEEDEGWAVRPTL